MGQVYRAVHIKTGHIAAIKVLTHAAQSANQLERFYHEAQILSALQHPHIARFYEVLHLQTQPCIVMEYIDGQTLAERIDNGERLALSEALYIIQPIIEAVGYIHQQGILHRDLKSSNIKISATGQVKLLDFGVAHAEFSPKLTATGGVVGTLQYLAPEQIKGDSASVQSDLWALGIILYEMFTGQVPFDATTIGRLCDSIKKAEYKSPSALNQLIPREVETIIARCLRRKPQDRYQSAEELMRDVRRLSATVVAQIQPEAKAPNQWRRAAQPRLTQVRNHWQKYAGTLAGLGLVMGLFGSLPFKENTDPAPVQPTPTVAASKPAQVTPTPFAMPVAVASSQVQVKTRIVAEDTLGQLEVSVLGAQGEHRGLTPFDFQTNPMAKIKIIAKKEGFEDYIEETEVGTEYRELRIFERKMKRRN